MSSPAEAVAALRAGEPVILPFDTVYGLAAMPDTPQATLKLYALKGRPPTQPTALVAASVDELLVRVPELRPREEPLLRALLPGGYTLILPNPSRRFPWLAGDNPDAIGVRVPQLTGALHDVVSVVGAVVATSANMPGGPDPATLDQVPRSIRAGAGAEIDAGRVPGTPSTVVDLTGPEPCVLRPGALAPEEVLRRLDAAVRSS